MKYLDLALRTRLGRRYWGTGGTGPVNQPPVTAPDSAATAPGTPVVINVRANDSDPEGGVLDLVAASAVSGTATIRPDDTILYTPAPGFTGTDTVTYTVADPLGATGQGTLTVTVAPVNQPPVTVADSATVFPGTPTVLDVRANDSDPEGGALTLVSASAVSGTVAVQPGGTLLYTPAPGFTGTTTVTYVVADPQGATTAGTAALTVLGPPLAITTNANGTLTVDASPGAVTITVTSPAMFAGSYTRDTTLLAGGPVNLVPPAAEGIPEVGQTLTLRPGLWITTGTAPAESFAWRRNGVAIPGAVGTSYIVTAADAGRMLTVTETLTDAAGSRTAESAGRPVPANFAPGDDPALIAWYDAADAATITATGGLVSSWTNKARPGALSGSASPPRTGLRTIGARNVLDFSGTNRLSGTVTLPANGNVAIHAVLAIDSVTSAFAGLLAMDATRDFQLDAASDTQFAGRLNTTSIGDTVVLSGGPFTGTRQLSVVFDRTGAGTSQVWINGVLAGSGAYTTPLDTAQALLIMANRSQNAFVDGAVGEVIVTGDVTNRALYRGYLADKWGII